MSAVVINLEIEKGTTFRQQFQWLNPDGVTPINLAGCTARSQWRSTIDSPNVLNSLTTENQKILIDESAGTITLHLQATETASYTFTSVVYDLEVVFPAVNNEIPVYRLVQGKIKFKPEVTR